MKYFKQNLNESMPRKNWTLSEKRELLELVNSIGKKWNDISYKINRTDDSCRNMWLRLTNPDQKIYNNEKKNMTLRCKWTIEEDKLIKNMFEKTNGYVKWKEIAASFPGRTPHSIRNRARRLQFIQNIECVSNDLDIICILLNEF